MEQLFSSLIPIVILLLVLHGCAYVLGFKDFVPNLVKRVVKCLVKLTGQTLLKLLRVVIEGIKEGLRAINRRVPL